MFKVLDYKLTSHPFLSKPLEDLTIYQKTKIPEFFDRFGYELTYIESELHKQNNISGHVLVPGSPTDAAACIQDWIVQVQKHPNLFLDHAHVNVRYAYEGDAKIQIQEEAKKNPRLNKLLNIRPKFMVDFCLDWIEEDKVVELIHIEHDFDDFDLYKTHLAAMEAFIQAQDWEKAYHDLKDFFKNSYTYDEYAQGRKKAEYYGLDKLEYLHEPKMLSYKKVF